MAIFDSIEEKIKLHEKITNDFLKLIVDYNIVQSEYYTCGFFFMSTINKNLIDSIEKNVSQVVNKISYSYDKKFMLINTYFTDKICNKLFVSFTIYILSFLLVLNALNLYQGKVHLIENRISVKYVYFKTLCTFFSKYLFR